MIRAQASSNSARTSHEGDPAEEIIRLGPGWLAGGISLFISCRGVSVTNENSEIQDPSSGF